MLKLKRNRLQRHKKNQANQFWYIFFFSLTYLPVTWKKSFFKKISILVRSERCDFCGGKEERKFNKWGNLIALEMCTERFLFEIDEQEIGIFQSAIFLRTWSEGNQIGK